MAIYHNATYGAVFNVKLNGVAVNITGWTFAAHFRAKVGDPDPPLVTLTSGSGFSIVDAVNGQFRMDLTAAQASALPIGHVVFDIMRTDVVDQMRLCGCRVRVKQPVTRL